MREDFIMKGLGTLGTLFDQSSSGDGIVTVDGEVFLWSLYAGDTLQVLIRGEERTLSIIEVTDGEEGDWTCETHFIFEIDGRTFKKTGLYRSHYGTVWDGPVREVQKVQKTITDWEIIR